MSTQTSVYTRFMEKGAIEIIPILVHTGPENIDNLEGELDRFTATEKNTL